MAVSNLKHIPKPAAKCAQTPEQPTVRDRTKFIIELFAGIVCVGIGYISSILQTGSSAAGIVALTVINIGWSIIFIWAAIKDEIVDNAIAVVGIIFFGAASAFILPLGITFDWLLVYVTVGEIVFYYPKMKSLILLSILVVLVTVGLIADPASSRQLLPIELLQIYAGFIFVYAFSYVARKNITESQNNKILLQELQFAHQQLRDYAIQSEALAITRERNRIARDIHDSLGHYLTILALQIETALKLYAQRPADLDHLQSELQLARKTVSECARAVHESVMTLRVEESQPQTLKDSLEELAAQFEHVRGDIKLALDIAIDEEPDLEAKMLLFRCVQEGLTNIRKHSVGDKALARVRSAGNGCEVTIINNGGAATHEETAGNSAGMGLIGLAERVQERGGSFSANFDSAGNWRMSAQFLRVYA